MSKIKTRKQKETSELRRQIEILKAQLKAQNIEPALDTAPSVSKIEKADIPISKGKKSSTENSYQYDFAVDIKKDITKSLLISSLILSTIFSIWIYMNR